MLHSSFPSCSHAGAPLRTCASIYVIVKHLPLLLLKHNSAILTEISARVMQVSLQPQPLHLLKELLWVNPFPKHQLKQNPLSCCNFICPTYSREFFAQQKSFSWKQDRDSRCCAGVPSVESDYWFGCFSLSIWYGCLGSRGWWCIFKPRADRNQVSSLYKRNINPLVKICLQHHWQTWNLSFLQNDWSSFLILKHFTDVSDTRFKRLTIILAEVQQRKDSLNKKEQEMGEKEVIPRGCRNGQGKLPQGRSISIHSCSESWNDGQGLSVPIPHPWVTCTDSDINLDLRCACLTPSEPSWRAECGLLNTVGEDIKPQKERARSTVVHAKPASLALAGGNGICTFGQYLAYWSQCKPHTHARTHAQRVHSSTRMLLV